MMMDHGSWPKWRYPPGGSAEAGRVFYRPEDVPAGWLSEPSVSAEAASEALVSRATEAMAADLQRELTVTQDRLAQLSIENKALKAEIALLRGEGQAEAAPLSFDAGDIDDTVLQAQDAARKGRGRRGKDQPKADEEAS